MRAARPDSLEIGSARSKALGEGLTGQCYAFPTLTADFEQRTPEAIEVSVREFIRIAQANPHKTFLLTRVGCGIAGYGESVMSGFFSATPSNIIKPEGWV